MARLDVPRPTRDGSCRVHDGELDLGQRGDAIEKRRAIWRRLREDGRDANRRSGWPAEPLDPGRRLALRSTCGSPAGCPAGDGMRRRGRVQSRDQSQQPPPLAPTGPASQPRERTGRGSARCSRLAGMMTFEALEKLEQRVRCRLELSVDWLARADTPRELGALGIQLGRDLRDLPQRDAALELALNVPSTLRRLALVNAVQQERVAEVVAVSVRQEPRPEVVVLALQIRRVVAESVQVEQLAIDQDARMVEG